MMATDLREIEGFPLPEIEDAISSDARRARDSDAVNHPKHYNSHPSGIECIDVVEHMTFNVGNASKYLWRAGLKSPDARTDLLKAKWYIDREIQRLNTEERKKNG